MGALVRRICGVARRRVSEAVVRVEADELDAVGVPGPLQHLFGEFQAFQQRFEFLQDRAGEHEQGRLMGSPQHRGRGQQDFRQDTFEVFCRHGLDRHPPLIPGDAGEGTQVEADDDLREPPPGLLHGIPGLGSRKIVHGDSVPRRPTPAHWPFGQIPLLLARQRALRKTGHPASTIS